MLTPPAISIRPAAPQDIPLVLEFIKALAVYEKLLDEVVATEEGLLHGLFGPRPYAEVFFAFIDASPAGFCLFFHNYSTFLGKPGIYIEDIFVHPEYRGKAVGKALFKHILALAKERECGRIEWSVLNWNKPAIDFYVSLGAKPMDEWTQYRLTKEQYDYLDTL